MHDHFHALPGNGLNLGNRASPSLASVERSCGTFLRSENGATDQFGDLRDYGVSEGLESKLVQPSSKPIIHSANRLKALFPRRLPAMEAKIIGMPGEQRRNCEGGAVIFPASFTVGVGNKPPTVSLVGRAKVASWYAVPLRIIPDLGQRPENVSQPSTKQLCDVFQSDVDGSNFANQSDDVVEQSASVPTKARSPASNAEVLAGEPGAYDVNGNAIGSKLFAGKLSDVGIAGDVWPMLGEDAAGELFDFTECDGLETARAFEAKAKPSYA